MYPALLPLMRTSRLPQVDWTGAPAHLNGLVCFAERRNLVSARVPSNFYWPLPVYHGPARESFMVDILWQRVLTFFLVIVIAQILHTRLRLNIPVIRRTCGLNVVGTLWQKQCFFGVGALDSLITSTPPPSCKASAETAHYNHHCNIQYIKNQRNATWQYVY